MAKGFPTSNPRSNTPGIRQPQPGSLMEYLRKNFPAAYNKVVSNPRDGVYDYKDKEFARKFPLRSGRKGRQPSTKVPTTTIHK